MSEITDIESVLNQGVKNVQITRLTAPGENYLGLVYRVDYEDQNGAKKSAVAKKLPTGRGGHMEQFLARSMRNEVRWYRDVVPLFKKLGRELEIDTDFYPDYIGARLTMDGDTEVADQNSVLIIGNLNTLGYKNEDRHEGFDLASTKAIVRMLAHFHGLPLAAKFKKPQEFKVIKEYLEASKPPGPPPKPKEGAKGDGPKKRDGPPDRIIFDKLLEMPEAEPYKSKIAELKQRPKVFPPTIKCGEEPWLTNTHSDFWINNVLIKSQEGETKAKMVDFQVYTYSSYVRDLVFFMLTSVSVQVQREHFDEMLRFYYDELTSIFKRLKIAELELSYEQYLNELKLVADKSEVMQSLFFCSVIFGPKYEVKDVLTGEGDMGDHLENVLNNMSERHKEKVLLIVKLAVEREWI